MKKSLLRLMVAATLIYSVFLGYFAFTQSDKLYHPYPDKVYPQNTPMPEMAEVHYRTADGLDLYGWYFDKADGAPLVVYIHGNMGDLAYQQVAARGILDAGYNLLLVEYRGFGGNPGKITEKGLFEDARTALKFAKEQGWTGDDTIIWGRSLGTGVAVKMATEGDYKALILEAPYSSVPDVAQEFYPYIPTHLVMRDRFDSASRIHLVTEPTLIYHGSEDIDVPAHFSATLATFAGDNLTRVVIEGANHTNLFPIGGNKVAFKFLENIDQKKN